jgi:UMF1 family MFS transporter
MKKMKDKFTRAEKSWMTYDLVSNAYATIVLAAIFPIYFNAVLGHNTLGLEFKGYASSFVMLIATISSPILGLLGDYRGMKKRLWASFSLSGVVFTLGLAFAASWQLLLLFFVLSNIAYNSAGLFYDSFITDVTSHNRMHRVSTWGFAVGYFGGGTALLIICTVLLFTLGTHNPLPVKISFGLTALWWLVFSLPMLFFTKQTHFRDLPLREARHNFWRQLRETLGAIVHYRPLFFFVLAYFFYIDGVGTVINMATSYGSTLGLSTGVMIAALLTTQIIGVPCSILFGRLAQRFGALKMIGIAIAIYTFICILGFYMGFTVENATQAAHSAAVSRAQLLFWLMAALVGTCQGGIQALSRSQFGRMIPEEKSNEYFGFFNIFNRFASIMGSFLIASITAATGRASFGILSVILLFIVGAVFLFLGQKKTA